MKNGQPVVGTPLDRVDGKLKVTGAAKYAAEFTAPNLAHAVIVQSTIGSGKVVKFDTAEASALPGVIAVITHEDASDLGQAQVPPAGTSHPLLDPEIRFSGQHLAVVVAETLEQAQLGAQLLKIEYETQQPEVILDKHLDEATAGSRGGSKRGDVQAGLASAAHKIDQIYRTPAEHHNPMEPHATVAIWDGADKLTAYDATQGVFGASSNLAHHFHLAPENSRVIDPFVGGGFGCKGQSWPHTVLAALAAKTVGRPVKLALSRRQMWTSNGHRPETRQALTIASDAQGKLVAINADMANHTSRLDSFTEPTGLDAGLTYSCPNVLIQQKLVKLDVPAPTYMRAPGEASGSFSIESAMDELAAELGIDPIEIRLRNYADIDESTNRPWSSKSLKECYAQGAEAFGWSQRNPKVGSMRKGNLLVGYGMATATYPANFGQTTARARINDNGTVLVQCGTQDLGTGTYTILSQIAADALGVDPQLVRVEIADTTLPRAPGSGGSTSAASAGSAVHLACLAVKKDVEALAAPGPSAITTYSDILHRAGKRYMEAEATAQPGPARTGQAEAGQPKPQTYSMHSFGAQFCEIHIDPDLGMIRVARWAGAFAVGTVLNKKTLTSQLQGGIVFGIGMALLEESMMDPRYGRYVNSNLAEYHLPVNKDAPQIDVVLVPEKDEFVNPIGVKGVGEIGITGVAAAVANAVYHATGKRIRQLPITLDKLL